MEKYPHSAEKKKHHKHHQEHLDSRLGKSEGPVGFNYEETVKNLNKYYRLGRFVWLFRHFFSTTKYTAGMV